MRRAILLCLLCACSKTTGLKAPGASGGSSGGGASGTAGTGSSTGGATATYPACVPPIALADVSQPTTTLSDCSFAALKTAVAAGGVIAITCAGTITFTETLALNGSVNTTIDGAGTAILDGGGKQMFTGISTAPDPSKKYFRDSDITFTLQRLTVQNAAVRGTKQIDQTDLTPADNCSTGYTDGAGGVLSVNNLTVHIIDCTFNDNSAEPLGPDVGGGAIYALGSKDVSIVGSTFSGNTGANGGAIGSLQSNLNFVNDTFSNNSALGFGANGDPGAGKTNCPLLPDNQYQTGSGGNGGAISIDGGEANADGSPTVKLCGLTFTNNHAGALGGAVFRTPDNSEQETDIAQSVFTGNTSVQGGGALYFHNSFLAVDACLFDSNHAQETGGAVFMDGSNPSFSNSTFNANESDLFGGAMVLFGCNAGAPCSLQNSTFSGNHGTLFAGALGGDAWNITNTVFANNTAPGSPISCASVSSGANDLQWPATSANDPACVAGSVVADPSLAPLADNGGPSETLLASATSPLNGAGANCSDHDERLHLRDKNKCSIGAVEVQP